MLRECDTRKSTKQTWAKVRHILGRDSTRVYEPVGIDAHKLNNHYAVISTDSSYTEPIVKLTVHDSGDLLTEIETFNMLDHLKTSAAGLNEIPALFSVRQHLLRHLLYCLTSRSLLVSCLSSGKWRVSNRFPKWL